MALEAEKRIPDITLDDNEFKDGDILHGADLNKVTSVLKAGVNENYKDLKASDALSNEHILDEVRHIKEQERNRWNNTYTKEEVYTREDVYTKNEVYNKSETYAKENLYTKEETYSKNDVYTKDNVYTKSEVDRQINDRITEIGASDMQKAVYDTNSNGIVDNSEKLGGQLPSYYATKTDVSTLQTGVSALQTKSFEGTSGTIETQGGYLHDMMIFGKSLQNGTPTPDSPIEIQSVVNPKVTVCGKNLSPINKIVSNNFLIESYLTENTVYTLSFMAETGGNGLNIKLNNNSGISIVTKGISQGLNTVTFTMPQNGNIYINGWTDMSQNIHNMQLELGSVATEYEPYKGQSATLPYTLNAIPVSSGGNVTINGQQYIADYVDIERKKLVRNVGNIILDGSYTYKTDNNSNGKYYYSNSSGSSTINMKENSTLLCNRAINVTGISELHKGTILSSSVIVIGNDNEVIKSAAEFKEWIGNNPYTVYYELATPTEIDLTDEEVAQFKALKTYKPTTSIIASSDVLNPLVKCDYSLNKETNNIYYRLQENASDTNTLQSDTYFKVGETLTLPNNCNTQGIITASAKTLFFILPLQKSLKNIKSATLNSITGVIRVNPYFTLSGTELNIVGGGYANGTTSTGVDLLTFATSHTVVINKEVGCLVLSFKKEDGWGCSTNTNCSVEIKNVSITFN